MSYFSEDFFFQFLLVNKVHRNLDELKHLNHEKLPDILKYFSSCMVNLKDALTPENIREMVQKEGHKKYSVDNVISYIQNMKNMYHLWQIQVVSNDDFESCPSKAESDDLDALQTQVLNTMKSFLSMRSRYYLSGSSFADSGNYFGLGNNTGQLSSDLEWTKILSVTGNPGTGKTKCLYACIRHLINNEL